MKRHLRSMAVWLLILGALAAALMPLAIFGAAVPGVRVTDSIVPTDDADEYPTHLAEYGKGGLRTVDTYADIAQIPTLRLEDGMEVYVRDEGRKYRLDGSLTNWVAVNQVLYVKTIAELLGTPPDRLPAAKDGDEVVVSGYRVEGDWGGPRSGRRVKSSSASTNLGCVFEPTGGGRWIFGDCFSGQPIQVRWFGAVGTNSSSVDDTLAIQNALNFASNYTRIGGQGSGAAHASFGGLQVRVPAGVYFVTSLIVPGHVTFEGEGPMRSILKRLPGQSGNFISAADGDGQRLTIRNLAVDGSWKAGTNIVNTAGHNIYLARTNYPNTVDGWPVVENVYSHNSPQSGLYVGQYEKSGFTKIGGMRAAYVAGCNLFANAEWGLVVDSTDGVYRDNDFSNNGIDGVYVRGSAVMNQFVGGRSFFNARHGFYAAGLRFNPIKALSVVGFRCDQNGFSDGAGSGFYLTNVWESSFSGIVAFGNTKDGATVMTSSGISISGVGAEFDYGVSDFGAQDYAVYMSPDSTNIVADVTSGFGHSINDVFVGDPTTCRAWSNDQNSIVGNVRFNGTLRAFGPIRAENRTLTNGPAITLESVTDQPAATLFVRDDTNQRFVFVPQAGSNYANLYVGGVGILQTNSRPATIRGDTPQAGKSTNEPAQGMFFIPPLGTGAGSIAGSGHLFYVPVQGASGTVLQGNRLSVRIDPNGAGGTNTDFLLWDGNGMQRIKAGAAGTGPGGVGRALFFD